MTDREPWNHDAFVRAYNEHAREFGGWQWDPGGPSEDKLREWYDSAIWDSLADFARTRFQLDQQY